MNSEYRVCHLTSVHPRYDARIFIKECCSLADEGYKVYLVVNDDKESEVINGVNLVSTGYTPRSRWERIIKGPYFVYKKAKEIDADLYHLHDPELLLIVNKLKRIGKKIIFDAHEDTEEQIKDKKWIPRFLLGVISRTYKQYVKKTLKRVDAVVTVTPKLVDKFKTYQPQTVMVTNYPIVKEETMMGKTNEKKSIMEKKYVCFAGGIEGQWMHENIINAIDQIDNVKYVLAGFGEEEYLNHLRSLNGWKKVEFMGKIPHERVRELYVNAVAGLAINDCAQLRGSGSLGNTKLFECMEAGVPVICTDYPLWKEVVEGNHCGICVNPRYTEALVEAIKYLIQHSEDAKEMGENGHRAVLEKYNWKPERKKIIQLYGLLLNEK